MRLFKKCEGNLRGALLGMSFMLLLCSCGTPNREVLVSVRDQRLAILNKGKVEKVFPISTSKFGLGSKSGSRRTPLGRLEIASKIGGGARSGAVFKSRRPTGEVLKPNAPGRDPIVTRIMWLRGLESHNRNTYKRLIYIHGTPEERRIGKPASYGCIRMKSKDVIRLYKTVEKGTDVTIIRGSLPRRRWKATDDDGSFYTKN